MSITTHEFFKIVNLGPHEEIIREMIASDNPGDPAEYGIICIVPQIEGALMPGWMTEPSSSKVMDTIFTGLL